MLSLAENMQKLGLGLIIISFLPWLAIALIVPFLPLSVAQKALLVPALLVFAEVIFWLGALLVGKEVVQRYRLYFNFRYLRILFKRWKRKNRKRL
ncbi:transporter suffix domain-containing protein [Anabaena azotica]|uniref:transporter suffix domain-containing protein n=1 Tax=Anabaena azotica TaxID=197653 RepID=UPI0039A52C92